MARKLILVKHSLVTMDEAVLRSGWHLSEEGRCRCLPLADTLQAYAPSRIIASDEIKAQETAELVAGHLGVPISVCTGIQENDRRGMGFVDAALYRHRIAMFFRERDERIMGLESANEALARFNDAVKDILATYPTGNLAVIGHGTVISLFISAYNAIDPFPFWQQLDFPSVVVLALPDFRMETAIMRIPQEEQPLQFVASECPIDRS